MSSPDSDISSELNDYMSPLENMLVHKKDFLEDFSPYDILENHNTVESMQKILTPGECQALNETERFFHKPSPSMKEPFLNENDKEQVHLLFSYLSSKSDPEIRRFINLLEIDYEFLVRKLERAKPNKESLKYVYHLRSLLSANQTFTEYNVHRSQPFVALLQALCDMKPSTSVVVHGKLGMGKNWLALDVSREYEVVKAMNFEIIFLDVGNCRNIAEEIRALEKLWLEVTRKTPSPVPSHPYIHISNRKTDLQRRIRKALPKGCLLILTNVHSTETLQTFDFACKRLITTRHESVCRSMAKQLCTVITLDQGLTSNEFFALMEKYLNCDRKDMPQNAIEVLRLTEGNPYLLSIIANSLRSKKSTWSDWIRALQSMRIKDDNVKTVIETSLQLIDEEALEHYAKLAIFPIQTDIPMKLLVKLWEKPMDDVDKIMDKLDETSLLHRSKNTWVFRIDFLYGSYLNNNERIQQMINAKALHGIVVDYFRLERHATMDTAVNQYFLKYIGYHLRAAEENELFSELYVKFGFLEAKIRYTGLPSTICDLKFYRELFTNGDHRKEQLFDDICDFLPRVEEKLVRSKDTRLLQYALMESGSVYEEAKRQAKHKSENVLLFERGSCHQSMQMVNLSEEPVSVHLLDNDFCLLILCNSHTVLADFSLDCSNGHKVLYSGKSRMVETQVFHGGTFVVARDSRNAIYVWTIGNDKKRPMVRRLSSRQKVHPFKLNQTSHEDRRTPINTLTLSEHITAFYVEEVPGLETFLHVAYNKDEKTSVKRYTWNPGRKVFELSGTQPVYTGKANVHIILTILKKYYLLVHAPDKDGNIITCYKLKDTSPVTEAATWFAGLPRDQPVACNKYEMNEHSSIYFIFSKSVHCVTFTNKQNGQLDYTTENVYNYTYSKGAITCSKISVDGKYLVLGTGRGLLLIDTATKDVLVRTKISEVVSCVDIYYLNDKVFKYMIAFGVRGKKWLNLFALRCAGDGYISCSHNITCLSNHATEDPQLEPDTRFRGGKLYHVTYSNNGNLSLLTADTRDRIHQMNDMSRENNEKERNWSIVSPGERATAITAMAVSKSHSLVAYADGKIYDLKREAFLDITFIKSPIRFLKIIDDSTLIATHCEGKEDRTYVGHLPRGKGMILRCGVRYGYNVEDLLLLIADNTICFLNKHTLEVYDGGLEMPTLIGACDFQNSMLFIAGIESGLWVFRVNRSHKNGTVVLTMLSEFKEPNALCTDSESSDDGITQKFSVTTYDKDRNKKVTCLTASAKGDLIACGYDKGKIELYEFSNSTIKFIRHALESHVQLVYDMKFSKDGSVLASCSEQLCFWNVRYIVENQLLKNSPKRRSSRFKSQSSQEMVDDASNSNTSKFWPLEGPRGYRGPGRIENRLSGDEASPWLQKKGYEGKPELYSCIKFDGNKAEQFFANDNFTQFNTIDDEGVYYDLGLLPATALEDTTDANVVAMLNVVNRSTLNIDRDMDYGSIDNSSCFAHRRNDYDNAHFIENNGNWPCTHDNGEDVPD